MERVIDELRQGLQDRYNVIELLGQGGMAGVFLADDNQLGRRVAIKVLRPELATSLGPERFQREIQVAASLSHPNILPLYDSGEVNGLFYYVMPYIQGESLADRLERETQLPIAEALAITRQVASALAAAHSQGVVHRDIKPDNILLADGRALVADFGIAHAIDAAGGEKLTQTGIAVGTPTYMSPEQAAGEARLDGRADIYSLGCVLYEMLIGEPPFTGTSMQVVFARHAMEDVPSLVTARRTIPEPIEEAVLIALAKTPADRYQDANEFAQALDVEVTVVTRSRPAVRPRHQSRRGWMIAAGVAVIAVALWLGFRLGGSAPAAGPADGNLIAVLPFRVVGTGDQKLRDLADGVVELMYYRLPGDPGPTVVYPATMRNALGDRMDSLSDAEAIELGRDVGAHTVLLGQIWDLGGDRLRLSATLRDVADAGVVARVENIEGPADSVVQLVDRLAGQLLVREAGVEGLAAGSLLSAELPALREYLAGQAAYGRGQYLEATEHYRKALETDSSFATAALGMALAGDFLARGLDTVGLARAWAARQRLDRRDSVFLVALAGPRYPADPTGEERLQGWEQAVAVMPDRRDTWHQLGEVLFHVAPAMDVPRAHQRAAEAFKRALEIDSTFMPALGHLLELEARRGDTAEVRRLWRRYAARDSVGDPADFYRWRVAKLFDDREGQQAIRDKARELERITLYRIVGVGQLDGTGMEDVVWAANELQARADRNRAVRVSYSALRSVALNRGRPAEAARIAVDHASPSQTSQRDALSLVIEAIYAGGDSALAAEVVDVRQRSLQETAVSGEPADRSHYDVCTVNMWHAAHGRWSTVPDAIQTLGRVPHSTDDYQTGYIAVCAAILEARLFAAEGRPDAGAALARLDSLARVRVPAFSWIMAAGNLTVAELRQAAGDDLGALAAARRFTYQYDLVPVALTTFLREEGRLAALVGDRQEAVGAYTHYLALRDDPEPVMAPEVDMVRRSLADALGEVE